MATRTDVTTGPVVRISRRSRRSVNTLPLISPSVILLFLWMIVPLGHDPLVLVPVLQSTLP